MGNILEAIGRNVPAISSSIADLIKTQEWSETNKLQQQAISEDIRQKKATFDYEQKKWQEEQEFLDMKQTEDMIFGDMPNVTPSQKKLLTGMGDKTGLWETVNGVRVMSNRNLKKAVTMMQTNTAFQKMLGEAGFSDLNKAVGQIDMQLQDPESKLKPEEKEALVIQKKTINAQRQTILKQLTNIDKAIAQQEEEEKAKRELIDKLTTEGKHTPESIAEYVKTGDISKLKLIEKTKEYAPQLKKWAKGKQSVYVDMNKPEEVAAYQKAGFVEYEKPPERESAGEVATKTEAKVQAGLKAWKKTFKEFMGREPSKEEIRKKLINDPYGLLEPEEETKEKYTVDKIYEDAQGNKAKYLGQGKWQTVK